MDKILITGGTGFVGHWLDKTIPYDKIPLGKNHVSFFDRHDLTNGMWIFDDWDFIIHAAPVSPFNILSYAKKHNSRVLYISSGIVYRPENDTEYRQNKMRWEQECLDSGVDVVIARLFTFYGEKLDEHKAYTQFKLAAEKGEPLRIWGDGKAIRSYMHGSEMARWLWAILLHGESGQAYDVGSDASVTMLELAQRMAQDHGNPDTKIVIENTVPDPMPIYLPTDTAKTKALLNKTHPSALLHNLY